jgi:hypothetical protein
MLPLLLLAALVARIDTATRRRRGAWPRLIWGPVPIIAIKYWSQALRARGYESRTCVHSVYSINERSDFDRHFDEFLPSGLLFDPLRAYVVFFWVLRTADLYLSYFDGGFLVDTALRRLELPLLRFAGKGMIVSPYGSDIAVPGHLGVAEAALLRDYPEIEINGERVRRRVEQFLRWANLVVRNYQYGYLPRWNVLWPTQIAIDTQMWAPQPSSGEVRRHDGPSRELVVLHAPNHRHIKGTDSLVEVIEELRSEGLGVRLELMEKRPNVEVRAAVLRSDIVAEQFIAGYALFAIEGMAAAKPVLSALSGMAEDVQELLRRQGLPIVDADLVTLKRRLRELIDDSERRQLLGEAGRQFVLRYHSYEAVGGVWTAIIEHVWRGAPLPSELSSPACC